jgi:hypothetical protein
MSDAIANALPTCICRTLGRVGFARGRKLLRKITNLPHGDDFGNTVDLDSQRGIWRQSAGESNTLQKFSRARIPSSGWAKGFGFRYNSKT